MFDVGLFMVVVLMVVGFGVVELTSVTLKFLIDFDSNIFITSL